MIMGDEQRNIGGKTVMLRGAPVGRKKAIPRSQRQICFSSKSFSSMSKVKVLIQIVMQMHKLHSV